MNKEVLIENMKERSLVAQRVVYDAVSHGVLIDKVDISTTMIHKVRGCNSKYKETIQDQKKISAAVKKESEEKMKRTLEVEDFKNKSY